MNGDLVLYNHKDAPVLRGHKIATNIYKLIIKPFDALNTSKPTYMFSSMETKQPWVSLVGTLTRGTGL